MTSDSNRTPETASAIPAVPPAAPPSNRLSQPVTPRAASAGLPQVGDLSILTAEPAAALDLSGVERGNATAAATASLIDQINAAPRQRTSQPQIVVPQNPSGLPFATTQAVPADAIPAALVAKEAAAEAAKEAAAEAIAQAIDHPEAAAPDPTEPEPTPDIPPPIPSSSSLVEGNHAPQVRFKNEQGKLLLILPSETNDSSGQNTLTYAWSEVMNQLRQRLLAEARHWEANTAVHLIARDRLLSAQQLQDIVEALGSHKMSLRRVYTSRRQTATTAATAGYSVEQHIAVSQLNPAPAEAGSAMAEPLVLKTTLRSGAEIRHNGPVVVIGDLNPGSAIVAEGDIIVWGRLRGNVHAGYKGDTQARIMALRMEPAQIRIAGFVARGPANPPQQFFPEVAYVTPQGYISIARVEDLRDANPATKKPAVSRKLPATGKRTV
jgi:septum site-determining protein MinC